MSEKSVGKKAVRNSAGRFVKGNPGGPGRPKVDEAAIVRRVMDGIEPHVRAAVEQTIAELIRRGTIPAGSASKVLEALNGMPLWLDVDDRRRPASLFFRESEQSVAGLPPGEAVRRCRHAIAEGGFEGYEELAESDHENAWIAREILAITAAYRARCEARRSDPTGRTM